MSGQAERKRGADLGGTHPPEFASGVDFPDTSQCVFDRGGGIGSMEVVQVDLGTPVISSRNLHCHLRKPYSIYIQLLQTRLDAIKDALPRQASRAQ